MVYFNKDILELARENTHIRQEITTADEIRVVLVNLPPKGRAGRSVSEADEVLVFVEGKGTAEINDSSVTAEIDNVFFIPEGTPYDIENTGDIPLKLLIFSVK